MDLILLASVSSGYVLSDTSSISRMCIWCEADPIRSRGMRKYVTDVKIVVDNLELAEDRRIYLLIFDLVIIQVLMLYNLPMKEN